MRHLILYIRGVSAASFCFLVLVLTALGSSAAEAQPAAPAQPTLSALPQPTENLPANSLYVALPISYQEYRANPEYMRFLVRIYETFCKGSCFVLFIYAKDKGPQVPRGPGNYPMPVTEGTAALAYPALVPKKQEKPVPEVIQSGIVEFNKNTKEKSERLGTYLVFHNDCIGTKESCVFQLFVYSEKNYKGKLVNFSRPSIGVEILRPKDAKPSKKPEDPYRDLFKEILKHYDSLELNELAINAEGGKDAKWKIANEVLPSNGIWPLAHTATGVGPSELYNGRLTKLREDSSFYGSYPVNCQTSGVYPLLAEPKHFVCPISRTDLRKHARIYFSLGLTSLALAVASVAVAGYEWSINGPIAPPDTPAYQAYASAGRNDTVAWSALLFSGAVAFGATSGVLFWRFTRGDIIDAKKRQ